VNAILLFEFPRLHDGVALESPDPADQALEIPPVSDFPLFDYKMKQVKRSGKVIAGKLLWSPETEEEIRNAFKIANGWRDSHAYPMLSIRHQLIYFIGYNQLQGLTAARVKRMQAIRRKLRRPDFSIGLDQMQDLGGCRAIMSSMADVETLVDCLRNRSRHELKNEDDYITNPKPDGYRSHHLIYKYRGKDGSEVYDGRRIEIQIRTRLQHAWATAVEGVGLFRGEDLNGHNGNKEWLRFFELISSEFAAVEGSPEVAGAPPRRERLTEIIALEKTLDAANNLDNMSNVVRWTELAIEAKTPPMYYLIKYDNNTKQVSVYPYFARDVALASYDNAEFADNANDTENENIVLVEADKIENLRNAYPNYFGDVQLFKTQLHRITKRLPSKEFMVKPQDRAPQEPRQTPDTSWFRRSRFGKPKLVFRKKRRS
jgi:Region found in RelA / SpoT proteins